MAQDSRNGSGRDRPGVPVPGGRPYLRSGANNSFVSQTLPSSIDRLSITASDIALENLLFTSYNEGFRAAVGARRIMRPSRLKERSNVNKFGIPADIGMRSSS
jgi:hypothetical protein